MNKENLLKMIAESGYNLGYGAKKHFATFDLIEKMPGWLSFVALVVGIFALFVPPLAANQVSAIMILFGIASLYINPYNIEKQKYEEGGKRLTDCYNKLRSMYYEVKSLPDDADFTTYVTAHDTLYSGAFAHTVSKQIFLSDWYAHYKFFWQQEIQWIDEHKHFTLLRDKLPLTFTAVVVVVAAAAAWYEYHHSFSICNVF
ncbi:MAG: SLATT domain-containing protein [Halobacteriota archaeon]